MARCFDAQYRLESRDLLGRLGGRARLRVGRLGSMRPLQPRAARIRREPRLQFRDVVVQGRQMGLEDGDGLPDDGDLGCVAGLHEVLESALGDPEGVVRVVPLDADQDHSLVHGHLELLLESVGQRLDLLLLGRLPWRNTLGHQPFAKPGSGCPTRRDGTSASPVSFTSATRFSQRRTVSRAARVGASASEGRPKLGLARTDITGLRWARMRVSTR